MKNFIKDFTKGILIFMGSLIIVIGIAYLGATAEKQRNDEIYNDGICTDCGGHYKLISISKSGKVSTTTYYYYQCDNCEKIIELRH